MIPAVTGLASLPPAGNHTVILQDRQTNLGGQELRGTHDARTAPASASAIFVAWVVHGVVPVPGVMVVVGTDIDHQRSKPNSAFR